MFYSAPSIANATDYIWTYSGNGAAIVGSTNAVIIYFSGAATSGNLTVMGTNACGNGTLSANYAITVNLPSIAPTSINASASSMFSGQSSTLSVSGGALGTGAAWQWYSGSCGGIPVGTGASITVSPTSTTTYYLRAEGTCNTTACASVTVNIVTCGSNLVITHTAGSIAPVTKTVTYGTVTTSISGTSKCWINQNLGADHQALSATDATEASAGWYWQFNRTQGYKHDGITRTPNTTWNVTIDNTYAGWDPAKDPCTSLLGTGWRLPTNTEWTTADGAPQNWNNYNDTYASVFKNSCRR